MSKKIKYFSKNTIGYDFIVGDIHGCYSLLKTELEKMEFNPELDRLFCVGDLVDRGPESVDVLDILAQPWFHSVLGNHDQMAKDYYLYKINKALDTGFINNYIRNGGQWFIDLDSETQKIIAQKLYDLPVLIEVNTNDEVLGINNGLVGIVHAECPVDDWNYLKEEVLSDNYNVITACIWSRNRIYHPNCKVIAGIDRLYHGHTVLKERITLGNRNYIDTGAVFGNKLTLEKL